jgi:hypothetical protein
MKAPEDLTLDELIDVLNRGWMTHDGMWFYQVYAAYGIEAANRLNKGAIASLAPFEMGRMKKVLGADKERFDSFAELRGFLESASRLVIPPFMNASMSFPRENVLHWEFAPKSCFAYKGIKRIGAIEAYECGVVYRLQCWFDALGLSYTVDPPPAGCVMVHGDDCSGDFTFRF